MRILLVIIMFMILFSGCNYLESEVATQSQGSEYFDCVDDSNCEENEYCLGGNCIIKQVLEQNNQILNENLSIIGDGICTRRGNCEISPNDCNCYENETCNPQSMFSDNWGCTLYSENEERCLSSQVECQKNICFPIVILSILLSFLLFIKHTHTVNQNN